MNFFLGLKAPFDGLKLFFKHDSLRKKVYFPFLLTLLISLLGLAAFFHWMPGFYDSIQDILIKHIESEIRSRYSQELLDMVMGTLATVLKMLVYMFGLLLLMLVIFIISSILCSVFWELLAEEITKLYKPDQVINKGFKNQWVEPMMRESVKQLTFALVILATYLVGFVPFVGSLISLVVGPIVVTIWFSVLVCDYWMNVWNWPIRQRHVFFKNHLMYLLGIGTYLIIPMVAFLLYPFFIIGATFQAAKYIQHNNQNN